MVVHIVLWRLKDEALGGTKAQNAAIIKERLEALVGKIDGLLKLMVNPGFNPNGMDLCLYSEFTDKAALDVYQVNELHCEVKEFVHAVAEGREVCDYAV